MPMRPETLKRMRALMAKDDPQTNCLPLATPRGNPYPFRTVETPTHLFIINESMHGYRQVFMDGRTHPDDLDPTWHGHSIGRWEGDTLVVDTVGFNDLTCRNVTRIRTSALKERELLAVRPYQLSDLKDVTSPLVRGPGDRDLIARFERALGPTRPGELVGGGEPA
jgi:hypothetical protein